MSNGYLITGNRFLAVEDNYFNRQLVHEILTSYGAEVDIVEDGTKAVQKVKDHEPDYYKVILMDIYLPDIDGYGASDRIREIQGCEKGKLKIVALSASKFNPARGKSLDGFCRKPFSIKELISVL